MNPPWQSSALAASRAPPQTPYRFWSRGPSIDGAILCAACCEPPISPPTSTVRKVLRVHKVPTYCPALMTKQSWVVRHFGGLMVRRFWMNDAPAAQVAELFADVDDLIRRVADSENPEIRKVRAKVYAAL